MARELMPLLGYTKWQKFEGAIQRAAMACKNAGKPLENHITGAGKLVTRAQGGGSETADYKLSRFACYLVAMNGDPRKPEIAAAQTYFAVRTRQAELAQPSQPVLSRMQILQMALEAEVRAEEAQAKVNELTSTVEAQRPAVEFVERFVNADGLYGIRETAKILGMRQTDFVQRCLERGVLFREAGELQPYAEWLTKGYMAVKAGEVNEHAYRQTRFTPAGLEWIAAKLNSRF